MPSFFIHYGFSAALPQVASNSGLLGWLHRQSTDSLSQMVDGEHERGSTLSFRALIGGLLSDYSQAENQAFRQLERYFSGSGAEKKRALNDSKTFLEQRKRIARLMEEAGVVPSHHIGHEGYFLRAAELGHRIRSVNSEEEALLDIYEQALKGWKEGGLGLFVPPGQSLQNYQSHGPFTAEEAAKAVICGDFDHWGHCIETAMKAGLLASALAFFAPEFMGVTSQWLSFFLNRPAQHHGNTAAIVQHDLVAVFTPAGPHPFDSMNRDWTETSSPPFRKLDTRIGAVRAYHINRATRLVLENRMAEGFSALLVAAELDPQDYRTLTTLGEFYRKQKKWEEAAKVLSQARDLKPDMPLFRFVVNLNLCDSLYMLNRDEEAKTALEEVLATVESERLKLPEYLQSWMREAKERFR